MFLNLGLSDVSLMIRLGYRLGGRKPQRGNTLLLAKYQSYMVPTWFVIGDVNLIIWLRSCLPGFYSVKLLSSPFFGNESLSSAHTWQSGGIKLHVLEESIFTYILWDSKSYFDNVFNQRILPSVDLCFVCVKKGNTVHKRFLICLCPEWIACVRCYVDALESFV